MQRFFILVRVFSQVHSLQQDSWPIMGRTLPFLSTPIKTRTFSIFSQEILVRGLSLSLLNPILSKLKITFKRSSPGLSQLSHSSSAVSFAAPISPPSTALLTERVLSCRNFPLAWSCKSSLVTRLWGPPRTICIKATWRVKPRAERSDDKCAPHDLSPAL